MRVGRRTPRTTFLKKCTKGVDKPPNLCYNIDITKRKELIKMYLIFDCEDTCVGTVLRHAIENTTIAEALTKYGFYLVEVDEMGNPKTYVEDDWDE